MEKTDKGITWDSPWGAGRPGWHTECVVMINNQFHGKLISMEVELIYNSLIMKMKLLNHYVCMNTTSQTIGCMLDV